MGGGPGFIKDEGTWEWSDDREGRGEGRQVIRMIGKWVLFFLNRILFTYMV